MFSALSPVVSRKMSAVRCSAISDSGFTVSDALMPRTSALGLKLKLKLMVFI